MAKYLQNPPQKIPSWPERNELNLLNAVLEIANEPSESYDPSINLFDRINKNMEKSLSDREILDKIKELRNRFEKRVLQREFGNNVKTTKAFAISEKIWGKAMETKIESIRKKKWMKEENANSLKVNPHEASRPNPVNIRTTAEPRYKCQPAGKKQKVKGSCFLCGNVGHFASDCSKKRITKQSTKQQETKQQDPKDISKGSVELQFKTENKQKELSAGSVLSSSQPIAQDNIFSQSDTRQSSSEQGVKYNQHTSEQRIKVPSNFKSGTYQHTPNQKKPFDRFRPSSHRHTSHQWKRESFTRPPKWGERVPYQYTAPPLYRQSPPPY